MKTFLLILITASVFSACSNLKKVQDQANNLVEDGKKSVNNVVEEVNTTKTKIQQKIDDVENAVDKVNEAKEALKKVTE